MDDVMQQVGEVREQLAGAIDFVLADLRQKWNELSGGPSVTEGIKQFVAAVDWTEPWIQMLLASHIVLLFVVISYRVPSLHAVIFFACMVPVYFAERLNRMAGEQWRSFAKQNYFDPQGIFISAVVSAPLVFIMVVILINYLITTSKLLITLKRKELELRARQQARAARAEQQGAGAGGASGEAKKEQ